MKTDLAVHLCQFVSSASKCSLLVGATNQVSLFFSLQKFKINKQYRLITN